MTKAVANSGVDIVLGWEKTQYKSRSLFVKYFLTRAYEEECMEYAQEETHPVEWDDYPETDEALKAAYHDLGEAIGYGGDDDKSSANYVYDNRVVTGSDLKLYPPRYGAKDK